MQQFSSRGKLCVVRAESSIFTIRVGRPLLFLLSGVINGHLMLAGLVFPHFCCILFFNLGSKWKALVAARIAAIIMKKRKGLLLQFWFCKKSLCRGLMHILDENAELSLHSCRCTLHYRVPNIQLHRSNAFKSSRERLQCAQLLYNNSMTFKSCYIHLETTIQRLTTNELIVTVGCVFCCRLSEGVWLCVLNRQWN